MDSGESHFLGEGEETGMFQQELNNVFHTLLLHQ